MRFKQLILGDKQIIKESEILEFLKRNDLSWVIDQELEQAVIEIKNKTLIWHDGYFSGNWYYGIFKDGEFHGKFINGIFEGGKMRGKFLSGVKLQEL
jgi:hypothetical protein